MKSEVLIIPLVLLMCLNALADLRPQALSALQLDGSPPLRGFAQAQPRKRLPPLFDEASGAVATLNTRYFHGPSELSYSVLLFPSKQVLADWDQNMRSSNPGWFSPLREQERGGIRESQLGGVVRPSLPAGRAVVVNRVVIVLQASQHREMIRRDRSLAEKALPDAELAKRMERVRAELIVQAKALPTNQ